ncbi:MAG: hypothetical protein DME07_00570 [Candidatus Rokuibacteriota bacterium]|nr:MAG: hypothetical protein DME07_00570 [Candidatus Rokubacteria bacterium]
MDHWECSRRQLLKAGLGTGLAGALGMPAFFERTATALAAEALASDRILVVLELSGGNDGLNTLVPYGDDAYYRHRPTIGLQAPRLRKIDDLYGFSPGMAGFERLYKEGRLAVLHGCGYDNPSFSHFSSMAFWHTAAPNHGEEYGWVGRLADRLRPGGAANFVVNIDTTQSLAVRSRDHTPVVFDDPERFSRKGFFQELPLFQHVAAASGDANPSRKYVLDVARSARDASALVREAWARYSSPIDYGIAPVDLPKVAALIAAGLPTRLYYASYRHNAFDTHVHQGDLHARLLTYVSDAVSGFLRDVERLGRADQVVMMIFSEFGRRVPENTSLGTDHGTANLMFVVGEPVKGGHYGQPPSLTELDAGDNLVYTTDFRRVYATVVEGWLGYRRTEELLRGRFEPFALFG